MTQDPISPPTRPRAGLLESTMQKLFTRRAQVEHIEEVGTAFRILTLSGDALRELDWAAGDKIQIQLGGWVQRTYTPMDWDPKSGRTRILVYLYAGGPGAQWGRSVRTGEECIVFGPRKSIKLDRPPSPVILFGDETSLGLAAALSTQVSPVQALFEVSTLADIAPVLERLQLHTAQLCVRLENDEHVGELETRLSALLQAHAMADIVLTGKASSIQQMSRVLRQRNVAAGRRQGKAYWAPGKTGLD